MPKKLTTIPNSYKSVPIHLWEDLQAIKREEFEAEEDYLSEVVKEFLAYYGEDISLMEVRDVISLKWLFLPAPLVDVSGCLEGFYLIEFNSLTLGEFIDLNTLLSQRETVKACALLLRKRKINEWGHAEIEPKGYYLITRVLEIQSLSVSVLETIINKASSYVKSVREKFPLIFPPLDETEEGEEEQPNESGGSWERFLLGITEGKPEGVEALLKLNAVLVLSMEEIKRGEKRSK